MTNNPTIDGVSRELLETLVKPIRSALDESRRLDARKDLRALLDAPVVERQEPYGFASVLIDNFQFSIDNGKPLTFSKGDLIWLIEQLSKSQSESSALQSTIAQLRIDLGNQTELTKQADYHASQRGREIAQLQARLAELESGIGEPVAEVIATGGPHDREDRVLCELQTELPPIGTKLYAAAPAPVAVVLPERKHVPDFTMHPMLNKEHSGWNACLDATAALNGVKP